MVPEKIDRYQILNELGRGGMATVYRAYDPSFKRAVAIKVLPREFLHDPTFRARFDREAQTIASLEHPAIVPVYDFGEESGQPFLVMRYMPGGSLSDRLKEGPLSIEESAQILARLASALERAHDKGVIHRDLKPQNILFDQYGNAFLSDFGSAYIVQASTALTGDAIIGTPAYMSPEQARGDVELDGRSDIYALGAILFEMLSGKQPYEADTPMGVAVKHITEPVPRILDVKSDLPPALEAVIARAMAKEPAMRYVTPTEMAAEVATLVYPDRVPGELDPGLEARPGETAQTDSRDRVRSGRGLQGAGLVGQNTDRVDEQALAAGSTDYPTPRTRIWLGIPRWIWIVAGVILASGICGLILIGGSTAAVLRNLSNPSAGIPATNPSSDLEDQILFQDDFSDPTSGWDRYAGDDAVTDYVPGGYRIYVNDENSYFWSNPYLYLSDVVVEVSATKLTGPDDNDFGLICRYQDPENFYLFLITSDGYYSINKYRAGELQIIGRESYTFDQGIRQGRAKNTLQAICVGDVLALSVNGTSLYEVRDSDLSAGDVGLIAGTFSEPGTDILFEDFRVMRPEK